MITIKFTVADVYGRPWNGHAPHFAREGHLVTEAEMDQAESFRIGGGGLQPLNVTLVEEAAFFDEHGHYSHFTGEIAD